MASEGHEKEAHERKQRYHGFGRSAAQGSDHDRRMVPAALAAVEIVGVSEETPSSMWLEGESPPAGRSADSSRAPRRREEAGFRAGFFNESSDASRLAAGSAGCYREIPFARFCTGRFSIRSSASPLE
jgi:hypothetical protein